MLITGTLTTPTWSTAQVALASLFTCRYFNNDFATVHMYWIGYKCIASFYMLYYVLDASSWHPFVKRSEKLPIFSSDICRSVSSNQWYIARHDCVAVYGCRRFWQSDFIIDTNVFIVDLWTWCTSETSTSRVLTCTVSSSIHWQWPATKHTQKTTPIARHPATACSTVCSTSPAVWVVSWLLHRWQR